ncbi:MAG: tetratricopeptide repeat protein [Chloroflexota bacterium]|nr:MAG: tetratricopeptide repeat protein [Chloroflexota bacterium]
MKLAEPLARLEITELIRRLDELDVAYLFKHALVQDTAYSSLLRNERKRLHRVIGETLEREYPHALVENAALLTKHFSEAGDDAKILEYATCAGDAEARVFAKAEAIEHYRAALDAALRLDAERETIIALATKLGRMYELRDDYTNALATYARLSELAREQNDARFELEGLMLQATLRATPTAVFEPRIGQQVCDRALALARELNDGQAEAKILWNLLLLKGFSGNPREGVKFGEQSLALARQLNLKTQIAYTLSDIGIYGYFANAQPEKARAALNESRAMWRELDDLPMLANNLNNAGILEYILGDFALSQTYYAEAQEISERIDSAWGLMLARSSRGVHAAEAGDYGAALEALQFAYDLGQRMGLGVTIIAATNLAIAYGAVGEIEAGYQIIQIAAREIEIPLYRVPAKAALAYLTFLRGEVERAESILQDAHPPAYTELEFSYLPSIIAEGEIGLATGRAPRVVEYTETVATNLIQFGIQNFVADADLYRGRALTMLERFDEARVAFERAHEYATRLGSQRVLWQLYAHWAKLERAQENFERAAELEIRARELIDSIAATLPEKYRAGFLQIANSAIVQ